MWCGVTWDITTAPQCQWTCTALSQLLLSSRKPLLSRTPPCYSSNSNLMFVLHLSHPSAQPWRLHLYSPFFYSSPLSPCLSPLIAFSSFLLFFFFLFLPFSSFPFFLFTSIFKVIMCHLMLSYLILSYLISSHLISYLGAFTHHDLPHLSHSSILCN